MTKSLTKKLPIMLVLCMIVMAMSICFASETATQADFVTALTTGINANSMWGAVVPTASIIIFVFIFAFAYGIIRRVLKKGSRGKFGM